MSFKKKKKRKKALNFVFYIENCFLHFRIQPFLCHFQLNIIHFSRLELDKGKFSPKLILVHNSK